MFAEESLSSPSMCSGCGILFPTNLDIHGENYLLENACRVSLEIRSAWEAAFSDYFPKEAPPEFVRGYMEAFLWAGVYVENEEGEIQHLDLSDEDPDSIISTKLWVDLEEDCNNFYSQVFSFILDDPKGAGMDFFLTRNRHGAGFFDRGYPADVEKKLMEAAHAFGTQEGWFDGKEVHAQ